MLRAFRRLLVRWCFPSHLDSGQVLRLQGRLITFFLGALQRHDSVNSNPNHRSQVTLLSRTFVVAFNPISLCGVRASVIPWVMIIGLLQFLYPFASPLLALSIDKARDFPCIVFVLSFMAVWAH